MKLYRINSSSKVNAFFSKILPGENYGDDGDDHTKINDKSSMKTTIGVKKYIPAAVPVPVPAKEPVPIKEPQKNTWDRLYNFAMAIGCVVTIIAYVADDFYLGDVSNDTFIPNLFEKIWYNLSEVLN